MNPFRHSRAVVALLGVIAASLLLPAGARAAEVAIPSSTEAIPAGPLGSTVPASKLAIADFINADARFSTLAKAIQIAGLTDTLNKTADITIFAPDDQAFAVVPKDRLAALLKNPTQLKALLLHHVAKGRHESLELLLKSPTLTALDGKPLHFVKKTGIKFARVDGSVLIGANLLATNGYLHVLNDVIWPDVVKPRTPGPVPTTKPIPTAKPA